MHLLRNRRSNRLIPFVRVLRLFNNSTSRERGILEKPQSLTILPRLPLPDVNTECAPRYN